MITRTVTNPTANCAFSPDDIDISVYLQTSDNANGNQQSHHQSCYILYEISHNVYFLEHTSGHCQAKA